MSATRNFETTNANAKMAQNHFTTPYRTVRQWLIRPSLAWGRQSHPTGNTPDMQQRDLWGDFQLQQLLRLEPGMSLPGTFGFIGGLWSTELRGPFMGPFLSHIKGYSEPIKAISGHYFPNMSAKICWLSRVVLGNMLLAAGTSAAQILVRHDTFSSTLQQKCLVHIWSFFLSFLSSFPDWLSYFSGKLLITAAKKLLPLLGTSGSRHPSRHIVAKGLPQQKIARLRFWKPHPKNLLRLLLGDNRQRLKQPENREKKKHNNNPESSQFPLVSQCAF